MAKRRMANAINDALFEELERDPHTILIGEDVEASLFGDTVGLIEPGMVDHYLSGGTLDEYLQKRNPAYVVIFPRWYADLSRRDDLLEEVFSVNLTFNAACAEPKMVVYQPRWNAERNEPADRS